MTNSWTLASLVLLIAGLTPMAEARTRLPVVLHYEKAEHREVWKDAKKVEIPAQLVEVVEIDNPSKAYAAPYTGVFLQNERIVVCESSCESPQNIKPENSGDDYRIQAADSSMLRQANVYFWVTRLFEQMETLGFTPKQRLIVRVDRSVKDPETGLRYENNAFFNDADWSLNFLPSSNSFMSRILRGGQRFTTSAYDPSVAMHEATHSVFQALIGPILNQEIYGLHEAFADYFSLTILADPHLGTVMGSGKPLRDATNVIKYKPGMEAHDLGAVVASAMWNIRGLYFQHLYKDIADRIALETIRRVSANPYASAGDVVAAYQQAFDALAPENLKADAALTSGIQAIWKKTHLQPHPMDVDTDVIQARDESSRPYTVTAFTTDVPEWVTHEFGMKKTSVSLGLLDALEGPAGTKTTWLRVSVNEAGEGGAMASSPIWILYDLDRESIVQALDLTFKPIGPEDSAVYARLLEVSGALTELIQWNLTFGADWANLKVDGENLKRLLKLKKAGTESQTVELGGQTMTATIHHEKVGTTLLAKVLGAILGKEIRASLKIMRQLDFVTVSSAEAARVPAISRLPELLPGERIIGYSVVLRTGIVKKVLLQDIR